MVDGSELTDIRTTMTSTSAARAWRWLVDRPLQLHGKLYVLLVALMTPPLFMLSFPPFDLWPLAFVALVPLTLAACGSVNAAWGLLAAGVAWLTAMAVMMNWLTHPTPLGYVAAVLAVSWQAVPALVALRFLYTRTPLPLVITLPAMWVAGEYLRSVGLWAFPWYLFAHPLWQQLWAIQVVDLFGLWGLSLAVLMVNGFIADVVLQPIWSSSAGAGRLAAPRRTLWGFALVVCTWIVIAAYGVFRLQQADDTMSPGPNVAVIQDDLPMTISGGLGLENDEILARMIEMSVDAINASPRPDLIAWPESMVNSWINREFVEAPPQKIDQAFGEAVFGPMVPDAADIPRVLSYRRRVATQHLAVIQELADRSGVPLLVGLTAIIPRPPQSDALYARYNSAIVIEPSVGDIQGRHDKIHVVPFGETVPFRQSWPWFYRFLNDHFTPFGAGGFEYSLNEGQRRQLFVVRAQGRAFRFATPICFESAFPELGRFWARDPSDPASAKSADFLVNMSNDGWFKRGWELPHHLMVASFRAIETRVGMARAVNTGISAFVKPTGEIYGHVRQNPTDPTSPYWTQLGMPELELVLRRDELRDRLRYEELGADDVAAVRREMQELTAAIEPLRQRAGVHGFSTQPVYIDTRHTVYSQVGDVLPRLLVVLLSLTLIAAAVWRKPGESRAWNSNATPAARPDITPATKSATGEDA